MNKRVKQQIMSGVEPQWRKLYDEALTQEDVREIERNISGFFDVLAKWDETPKRLFSDTPFQSQTSEEINESKKAKKCA